jgi:DNA-binding NarL/FixJ family response regulator
MEGAARARRILYIDDEREAAQLVREELMDQGFEVILARDGSEGFAAILEYKPDLVLCDVNMPGMSGFEVLEKLTQLAPRFARMPFVFLTAMVDRQHELKGRALGADDYVTKPVDFDILVAIIRARLAGVARLELWPLEVALTQREIETLTWSARGKTSAEIAAILGLTKRTVDFHVENARDKLGVATRIEAVVKAATGGLIEP